MNQLASVCVGAVLLIAALGKWLDINRFASVVLQFRVVSPRLARMAAAAVVVAETVLGITLVARPGHRGAAFAALALLAAFTGVIVLTLLRGLRDVDCGCIRGFASGRMNVAAVIRNLGLLTLACQATSSFSLNGRVEAGLFVSGCLMFVVPVFRQSEKAHAIGSDATSAASA